LLQTVRAVPDSHVLPMNQKYCHACGAVLDHRAELCPKCGVRQQGVAPLASGSGRSRIAAALFALFLGGIGIHKFYLGQVGQGILYMLFFWTFIPAFIALIEAIILLTQSDEAFAARFA